MHACIAESKDRVESAVVVRPAAGKGMGVFAEAAIAEGEWVCRYEGEQIDAAEYSRLYDTGEAGRVDYVFQLVSPDEDDADRLQLLHTLESPRPPHRAALLARDGSRHQIAVG